MFIVIILNDFISTKMRQGCSLKVGLNVRNSFVNLASLLLSGVIVLNYLFLSQ
jgi:hypothetical protein